MARRRPNSQAAIASLRTVCCVCGASVPSYYVVHSRCCLDCAISGAWSDWRADRAYDRGDYSIAYLLHQQAHIDLHYNSAWRTGHREFMDSAYMGNLRFRS